MKYTYHPRGTCSSLITLEIKDGLIHNVQFRGGCHGNLQGIARLVEGMPYHDVIERCKGIRCGWKNTSCPDQLARAVQALVEEQAKAGEQLA